MERSDFDKLLLELLLVQLVLLGRRVVGQPVVPLGRRVVGQPATEKVYTNRLKDLLSIRRGVPKELHDPQIAAACGHAVHDFVSALGAYLAEPDPYIEAYVAYDRLFVAGDDSRRVSEGIYLSNDQVISFAVAVQGENVNHSVPLKAKIVYNHCLPLRWLAVRLSRANVGQISEPTHVDIVVMLPGPAPGAHNEIVARLSVNGSRYLQSNGLLADGTRNINVAKFFDELSLLLFDDRGRDA